MAKKIDKLYYLVVENDGVVVDVSEIVKETGKMYFVEPALGDNISRFVKEDERIGKDWGEVATLGVKKCRVKIKELQTQAAAHRTHATKIMEMDVPRFRRKKK